MIASITRIQFPTDKNPSKTPMLKIQNLHLRAADREGN
jgi:hypothetical protein